MYSPVRKSTESLGRSVALRKLGSELNHRTGSSYSLNTTRHWTGSAFILPQDNATSQIPPLGLPEGFDTSKVPWWTSKRFCLALMCFFGTVSLQAMRVTLSIAIVTMVHHTGDGLTGDLLSNTSTYNISVTTNISSHSKCPDLEITSHSKEGELYWNKELQGLILGSFYWGYLLLQISSGWLSEKFGAKRVILVGMFGVVFITMVSPVCARTSPYLFIAARFILGVCQSVYYPAIQALWVNWAPPFERTRLLTMSYGGSAIGVAIMFPLGGVLSRYGFDGGWPSVFYLIGILGFIWLILWAVLTSNTPANHPTISTIEREYIQLSLGIQSDKLQNKTSIPWKSIIKSKAVWAVVVAHVTANFGNYMFSTQLPTYQREVLKLDIQSNGLYSMLPFISLWFLMLCTGTMADLLIMKKVLSVGHTRKLMTHLGMIVPGLFLIGTSYMECDQQTAAITMMTLAVALGAFHMSGFFVNMSDIAPAYAGTILGISNMFATISGIIAPYVAGVLTTHGTRAEWQMTFYIAAGVLFAGSIFYGLFGEGDVQSWGHIVCDTEETIGLAVNKSDSLVPLTDIKHHSLNDIRQKVTNNLDCYTKRTTNN